MSASEKGPAEMRAGQMWIQLHSPINRSMKSDDNARKSRGQTKRAIRAQRKRPILLTPAARQAAARPVIAVSLETLELIEDVDFSVGSVHVLLPGAIPPNLRSIFENPTWRRFVRNSVNPPFGAAVEVGGAVHRFHQGTSMHHVLREELQLLEAGMNAPIVVNGADFALDMRVTSRDAQKALYEFLRTAYYRRRLNSPTDIATAGGGTYFGFRSKTSRTLIYCKRDVDGHHIVRVEFRRIGKAEIDKLRKFIDPAADVRQFEIAFAIDRLAFVEEMLDLRLLRLSMRDLGLLIGRRTGVKPSWSHEHPLRGHARSAVFFAIGQRNVLAETPAKKREDWQRHDLDVGMPCALSELLAALPHFRQNRRHLEKVDTAHVIRLLRDRETVDIVSN